MLTKQALADLLAQCDGPSDLLQIIGDASEAYIAAVTDHPDNAEKAAEIARASKGVREEVLGRLQSWPAALGYAGITLTNYTDPNARPVLPAHLMQFGGDSDALKNPN